MVFQIIYNHYRQQAREEGDGEAKSRALLAYQFLRYLGATYRDMGPAAISCYCYYLYMPLVNYLLMPLYYEKYMQVEQNTFFIFLRNLRAGKRLVGERIKSCVAEVVQSSLNYQYTYENKSKHRSSERHLTPNQFGLLQRQHRHLLHLMANQTSLWPSNRNQAWRDHMQTFILRAYYVLESFNAINGFAATLLAQRMAHRSNQMNQLIPEAWRHFSQLDRLFMVEQMMMVCLLSHHFVYSFVLCMAILKDQLHQLDSLRAKFGQSFSRSWSGHHRLNDRRALELYIGVMHFSQELKPGLEFLSVLITLMTLFCILLTSTTLFFIKSIELHELNVVAVLAVVVFMLMNQALASCAYFNSKCTRLVKLIYTLVGVGVHQHLIAQELESLPHNSVGRHPSISRHTLLIWSRLMEDSDRILDKFNCRVYGVMRVSYTSLLRFNFWVVSTTILALTFYF